MNLQPNRGKPQNQADLTSEHLLEKLNQSEQKLSEVTLQKEYLNYI